MARVNSRGRLDTDSCSSMGLGMGTGMDTDRDTDKDNCSSMASGRDSRAVACTIPDCKVPDRIPGRQKPRRRRWKGIPGPAAPGPNFGRPFSLTLLIIAIGFICHSDDIKVMSHGELVSHERAYEPAIAKKIGA